MICDHRDGDTWRSYRTRRSGARLDHILRCGDCLAPAAGTAAWAGQASSVAEGKPALMTCGRPQYEATGVVSRQRPDHVLEVFLHLSLADAHQCGELPSGPGCSGQQQRELLPEGLTSTVHRGAYGSGSLRENQARPSVPTGLDGSLTGCRREDYLSRP